VNRRALALLSAALVAAPATAAAQPGTAPAQGPTAQPGIAPAPYSAPAPPAPSPFGSMQAGGLTPPPPLPATTSSGAGKTEEQLDLAKKQDAGRGLEWAWLNVEGGFSHVGLHPFSPREDSFTAGFVDPIANGGYVGAGLGARVLFFTVGARGRITFSSAYRIYSVGGEAGLHIPIGKLDPHVDLGGGYAALANIHDARTGGDSPLSIRGYYLRIGGGLDYYLSPVFSIGLNVSGDLLGLTRGALPAADLAKLKANPALGAADQAAADKLSTSAFSLGAALAVTGLVGLHF
jgi:hypothetical protein